MIASAQAAAFINEPRRPPVRLAEGQSLLRRDVAARSARAIEADRVRAPVGVDEFELYLPAGPARLPDEQIELRRFPLPVEAYWDGCAWIV